ncbi:MAG: PorP/SprF family type IX secretion system membrane protein [Flavobacteriales bacterium]
MNLQDIKSSVLQYCVAIACILSFASSFAQDVHFSQFTSAPMALNPALTGDINGEFRLGYLYRNQWNSVASPFISSTFYADKKFLEEKLNGDFIGAGFSLISDNTGSGSLSMLHFGLNSSYHHFLNKTQTRKVYGGLQIALFQKSINPNILVYENQFNYVEADFNGTANGENLSSLSIIRPDIQIGGGYWLTEKKYYLNTGFSIAHINVPDQSFTGSKDRLAPKFILHADGQYNISKHLFITPSVMFMYQHKAKQFNIGAVVNHGFGKSLKENVYLKAGVWYRVGDAFNFLVGVNHNNWQFNFTYDVNASSLTPASNYNGALELSIIYTHNLFNIQKNKLRTIPCNRLF